MKRLQGAMQAAGHRVVHLADSDDVGLLRFEETGESPEGMDFAVRWNGAWCEGRCYASFPDSTFVTSQDAQRLPLGPGMQARLPLYEDSAVQLVELARAYVQELGDNPTREASIVGMDGAIAAGESTQVAVSVEHEQSPEVVTISLYSSGDILLVAESETFLTPDSEETMR
jgi:hypothetical protein